jgi:hypothetical protein
MSPSSYSLIPLHLTLTNRAFSDNLSFLLKHHTHRFRDTSYTEIHHDSIDLVVMSFGTRVCMALLLSTGRGQWEVVLKGKETVFRDQAVLRLSDAAECKVGWVLEKEKVGKRIMVWDRLLGNKARRDEIEEQSGTSSRSSSAVGGTS